jgi:hypothetical protein
LRALSAHEPVIALAGLHMAADDDDVALGEAMRNVGYGVPGTQPPTPVVEEVDDAGPMEAGGPVTSSWGGSGKVNAADVILRGYAQWRPKPDANGKTPDPVPAPGISETLPLVRQLAGSASALEAGREAMYAGGTSAAYVGLKLGEGDKSNAVDQQRLVKAALIAVKGNVPLQGLASNETGSQGNGAVGDSAADQNVDAGVRSGASASSTYGVTSLDDTAPLPGEEGGVVASRGTVPSQSSAAQASSINDASGKAATFMGGLNGLFEAAQVGDPTSYNEDQLQARKDDLQATKDSLSSLAKEIKTHPEIGQQLLQEGEAAMAANGLHQKELNATVSNLVDLIVNGDPNLSKEALSERIGAGLHAILSKENRVAGTKLLLGKLAMSGDLEKSIDTIVDASEVKDPNRSAYLWQSFKGDEFVTALFGGTGQKSSTEPVRTIGEQAINSEQAQTEKIARNNQQAISANQLEDLPKFPYKKTSELLEKWKTESKTPHPELGENVPVKYLNAQERASYELHVKDGLLYDNTGKIVDSRSPGIFVMSPEGRIYFAPGGTVKRGQFQHSSFLAGAPVAAAGEMVVVNGEIRALSRRSGHYWPSQENAMQFLSELARRGVVNARKITIQSSLR